MRGVPRRGGGAPGSQKPGESAGAESQLALPPRHFLVRFLGEPAANPHGSAAKRVTLQPAAGGLAPDPSSHGPAAGLTDPGRTASAFSESRKLISGLSGEARNQRLHRSATAIRAFHVLLTPGEDQLFENVVARRTAILEDRHISKMEKSSKKDILPGMNTRRGSAPGTPARRSQRSHEPPGDREMAQPSVARQGRTFSARRAANGRGSNEAAVRPPSGFCLLFLLFRGYRLEVLCLENFFTIEAFHVVHIAISGNDFGARVLAVRLHIDGLSLPIKCGCYEEVVASSMRDEHTDRPYFIHPLLIVKRSGFEKMHPKQPLRQK